MGYSLPRLSENFSLLVKAEESNRSNDTNTDDYQAEIIERLRCKLLTLTVTFMRDIRMVMCVSCDQKDFPCTPNR